MMECDYKLGCLKRYINSLAHPPAVQEGGSGGDDSPSSHDSGLGGNITGMPLCNTNLNNDGGMSVEGANCTTRTDSATPPASNSSIEMEVALRGMEQNTGDDTQESYKNIHSQRINTSSPLSCPSSPLSAVKIHSTFNSNSTAITDSSSSSKNLTVQNNHACQSGHISDWPPSVTGLFWFLLIKYVLSRLNKNDKACLLNSLTYIIKFRRTSPQKWLRKHWKIC